MAEETKLNKAQKEAVEHVNGPLLIVAGAGTGKTTVITKKIAYILENGLAKPEEILALTFTDKAAAEMQERVDKYISIGYSDIQISTFHAFCQRILEHHAIDIGLSNQFKLLTQTSAWLLIQKNFHKFNLEYYRPLGNPYRHIHELIKHFSKCKDELISPEDYLAHAEETGKNSGDMVIEEKNRLNEIAGAYHVYNQILRDNAAMDFGDLIFYTNQLFQKRPKILANYQAKFKFILVDEFQDVNWAQYYLLQLLSNKDTQLTVVGDDDQSIYAFRGASVSNILHFKDDFPKATEIVLSENYRSVQPILDAAYTSIQNNNPDRLEIKLNINKRLHSPRILKVPNGKKTESVVHLHCKTLDDEVESTINEILRLKKIDKKASWDDFAILVRANNHAEPFINGFERHGLPFEFLAAAGLYRQPIIIDCLAYLRLMIDPKDSVSLYRLLCLNFLDLKINDLVTITYNAKKSSLSYYSILRSPRSYGVSEEGIKICDKLLNVIDSGLRESKQSKPYQLLVNFLTNIGYFENLLKGEESRSRDANRDISHLEQFLNSIKEYEAISPDARTADYLNYLNSSLEAGDSGGLSQPSDTPDSINILTIHASKGLEFKYVFVVNLVEDRFPSRRRGEPIEIPAELVKEKLPEGDGHIQEERRLFYVAITRAKDRLFLTSASDYGGERTKKISRFLNELGFKVDEVKKTDPIFKKSEVIKETKGEFVFELPKAFSFSQIRAYETCPYQYKLAHILKIPTRGSASFSFGQSIHGTLQTFYNRVKELNQAEQISLFSSSTSIKTAVLTKVKVPTLEELLVIYDKSWIADWYRDENQREEYYKKGKEILKVFYKSQENNWNIPETLEKWFKIKIGDYFIHGRIDRVDKLEDGTLEIIDYKTGKSKEKLSLEDKEQLFIYQIAIEQITEFKNLGKPGKLTYYYINDDIRTSFLGEKEDLKKLEGKLLTTMDKIYSKDFSPAPSQFSCGHCDFKDICEHRV